jgi:hypothetical protein
LYEPAEVCSYVRGRSSCEQEITPAACRIRDTIDCADIGKQNVLLESQNKIMYVSLAFRNAIRALVARLATCPGFHIPASQHHAFDCYFSLKYSHHLFSFDIGVPSALLPAMPFSEVL